MTKSRKQALEHSQKNNEVFRVQHKLSRDDIQDITKKSKGYPKRMPESEHYKGNSYMKISNPIRQCKCHHRNNLSSKTVLRILLRDKTGQ
ncbi:1275_t:CDS:2 [Cetraspora pellucida]|uniref:1275_t:CDS:1 n=1 Tax=Cetraspora pellucida TaxID=1433469 RepID=A0A9N9NL26_9GLOM|nr:1275_t:CDS:2 [Cetraspora pellucida]